MVARSELRVPYNREDRRGGSARLTIDESIANSDSFAKTIGLDGIGLYCVLARHPGITAQQIQDSLDIGKDKLRVVVEKLVAAKLLLVTRHYGAPSTFSLLTPPHPNDCGANSFAVHFAENPPIEGGKSADSLREIRPQFAENPPTNKEVIQDQGQNQLPPTPLKRGVRITRRDVARQREALVGANVRQPSEMCAPGSDCPACKGRGWRAAPAHPGQEMQCECTYAGTPVGVLA